MNAPTHSSHLSNPATANGMTRLDAVVIGADVAGLYGCEPAVDFFESPVVVDNSRELLSIGRRDDLHRATWCPTIVRASERCPHVQLLNHAATR